MNDPKHKADAVDSSSMTQDTPSTSSPDQSSSSIFSPLTPEGRALLHASNPVLLAEIERGSKELEEWHREKRERAQARPKA